MLIPRWWRASVNVAPSIGRAVWSKQSFICRRRNTVVNKLKNTSIVYIHFIPALSWSHLHRENWVYSGNTGHKGQFRVCNLHIDAFLYLKDTLDTGAVRLCLPLFHTLPPCEHHSPKMGSDKTPGRLLHLWEAASASGCLQHCLLGNALLQHKKRNHHSCSYQLKKEKRDSEKHVLIFHTWGEDVWVEANIEGSVADRTHRFAGVQDDLSAFGVCFQSRHSTQSYKQFTKTINTLQCYNYNQTHTS